MRFVTVDRVRRTLTVTTSGFVPADEVAAIAREVHEAIALLGGRSDDHVTLYDLSAVSVAAAEVVALFREYVANEAFQTLLGRRMAFVSTSALLTMQLRRVARDMPQIQIFSDRAAAMEWLLSA